MVEKSLTTHVRSDSKIAPPAIRLASRSTPPLHSVIPRDDLPAVQARYALNVAFGDNAVRCGSPSIRNVPTRRRS